MSRSRQRRRFDIRRLGAATLAALVDTIMATASRLWPFLNSGAITRALRNDHSVGQVVRADLPSGYLNGSGFRHFIRATTKDLRPVPAIAVVVRLNGGQEEILRPHHVEIIVRATQTGAILASAPIQYLPATAGHCGTIVIDSGTLAIR